MEDKVMNTCDDKKIFNKYKKRIESDLRSYPFWLIAIECPNLGYPTRWGNEGSSNTPGSFVESSAFDDMERQWKVNAITKVLEMLDSKSKELIEKWYFRDTYSREELLQEMGIDKNKFYYYRDRALRKFMVSLNYI
ncbi:nitroreductase [Clostridium botulinum]|nr:nitroreductase [Clostridium botulinum]